MSLNLLCGISRCKSKYKKCSTVDTHARKQRLPRGNWNITPHPVVEDEGPGEEIIARATRCDAAHLRLWVPNELRCLKIACDVLRLKVQHA